MVNVEKIKSMRLNVEDAPAAMKKRPMKEPAGEPLLMERALKTCERGGAIE